MKQIVCLNSCMPKIYRIAFLFAPVPDTAAQAFASCMELQQNWLALLAPYVFSHVSTAASNSGSQAQPTADELAHYMDIAIGERFTAPGMTFTTSSGHLAKHEHPTNLALVHDATVCVTFSSGQIPLRFANEAKVVALAKGAA
jgi:hypothetical protein